MQSLQKLELQSVNRDLESNGCRLLGPLETEVYIFQQWFILYVQNVIIYFFFIKETYKRPWDQVKDSINNHEIYKPLKNQPHKHFRLAQNGTLPSY